MNTMSEIVKCAICGKEINPADHYPSTGYGKDDSGRIICYEDCAEIERQYMRDQKRITLYLQKRITLYLKYNGFGVGCYGLFTWPGIEIARTADYKQSRSYNGKLYLTVYFIFEGKRWYGRHYGDDSDLIHCKQLKG
jgi:hypothetical protein